jgi:hypothetical protein
VKRELERIEIPGEHEARERTWTVLRSAFEQRTPVERRPRYLAVAAAVAVALAIVGSAFSPPGKAVLDQIRDAVGVENAAPALFELPAPGRLLVHSDRGVWVVQQDGSRRLLGSYRDASWSPFGRYVVAARQNELAALEPDGTVRWTLARPDVRSPRWTGSRTDTRIAYVDRSGIRVLAGDGTGDRLVVAHARGPVAWRPGSLGQLAEVVSQVVRVQDVESGRVLWRARLAGLGDAVRTLLWSSDGRRLLVVQRSALRVYDVHGRIVARDDPSDATEDVDASFVPGTQRVVVVRRHGAQSTIFRLDTGGAIFGGTGVFAQVAFSPDARFAFVAWPTADQWVFVRIALPRRIRGVSNVSLQFHSRSFPRVDGWTESP